MIATDSLNQLADTMKLLRVGPALIEPGQPVLVKLMPPTWELIGINPLDSNSTEAIIPANLPLLNPSTSPITIPVHVPTAVPLTISVEWYVEDENGSILTERDYKQLDSTSAPTEASFILSPPVYELTNQQSDIGNLDLSKSKPIARKIGARVTLDTGIANPANPSETIKSDQRTLIPIQIQMEVLSIPTILALFIHRNYKPYEVQEGHGAVLIVTPSTAVFKRIEDLQVYLKTLEPVLERLSFLARFAALLVGLRALANALYAQPRNRFVSANKIWNLNKIKMIDIDEPYTVGSIAIPGTDIGNDIEAEDVFSSLILVGPPPIMLTKKVIKRRPRNSRSTVIEQSFKRSRSVSVYVRRDFKPNRGKMKITLGIEMCVLIPDLHKIHNTTEGNANCIPPNQGRIQVVVDAAGPEYGIHVSEDGFSDDSPAAVLANFGQNVREDGFGDRLSSLEFSYIDQESKKPFPI